MNLLSLLAALAVAIAQGSDDSDFLEFDMEYEFAKWAFAYCGKEGNTWDVRSLDMGNGELIEVYKHHPQVLKDAEELQSSWFDIVEEDVHHGLKTIYAPKLHKDILTPFDPDINDDNYMCVEDDPGYWRWGSSEPGDDAMNCLAKKEFSGPVLGSARYRISTRTLDDEPYRDTFWKDNNEPLTLVVQFHELMDGLSEFEWTFYERPNIDVAWSFVIEVPEEMHTVLSEEVIFTSQQAEPVITRNTLRTFNIQIEHSTRIDGDSSLGLQAEVNKYRVEGEYEFDLEMNGVAQVVCFNPSLDGRHGVYVPPAAFLDVDGEGKCKGDGNCLYQVKAKFKATEGRTVIDAPTPEPTCSPFREPGDAVVVFDTSSSITSVQAHGPGAWDNWNKMQTFFKVLFGKGFIDDDRVAVLQFAKETIYRGRDETDPWSTKAAMQEVDSWGLRDAGQATNTQPAVDYALELLEMIPVEDRNEKRRLILFTDGMPNCEVPVNCEPCHPDNVASNQARILDQNIIVDIIAISTVDDTQMYNTAAEALKCLVFDDLDHITILDNFGDFAKNKLGKDAELCLPQPEPEPVDAWVIKMRQCDLDHQKNCVDVDDVDDPWVDELDEDKVKPAITEEMTIEWKGDEYTVLDEDLAWNLIRFGTAFCTENNSKNSLYYVDLGEGEDKSHPDGKRYPSTEEMNEFMYVSNKDKKKGITSKYDQMMVKAEGRMIGRVTNVNQCHNHCIGPEHYHFARACTQDDGTIIADETACPLDDDRVNDGMHHWCNNPAYLCMSRSAVVDQTSGVYKNLKYEVVGTYKDFGEVVNHQGFSWQYSYNQDISITSEFSYFFPHKFQIDTNYHLKIDSPHIGNAFDEHGMPISMHTELPGTFEYPASNDRMFTMYGIPVHHSLDLSEDDNTGLGWVSADSVMLVDSTMDEIKWTGSYTHTLDLSAGYGVIQCDRPVGDYRLYFVPVHVFSVCGRCEVGGEFEAREVLPNSSKQVLRECPVFTRPVDDDQTIDLIEFTKCQDYKYCENGTCDFLNGDSPPKDAPERMTIGDRRDIVNCAEYKNSYGNDRECYSKASSMDDGGCVGDHWFSKTSTDPQILALVNADHVCKEHGYLGIDEDNWGYNEGRQCAFPGDHHGVANRQGGDAQAMGTKVSFKCAGSAIPMFGSQSELAESCLLITNKADCKAKCGSKLKKGVCKAKKAKKCKKFSDIDMCVAIPGCSHNGKKCQGKVKWPED